MSIAQSTRLAWLVAIELAKKYTRSLILGFFVGLLFSTLFWKLYPLLQSTWFEPVERIGLVGDFTPSSLPLSVQNLISGGLTTLGTDGSAQPNLTTAWEATNSGKTFIFSLSGDKKWHNGAKVTAHDINYNIRGVTLIPSDEHTLVAHLQYPYSAFPALVSKPIFLPGLQGFGEYEVKGIKLQGDLVQSLSLYPANDPKKHAKFYTFYRTEAQAILGFKQGDLNVLEDISTPSALAQWGNVQVEKKVKYDRVVALFFNLHSPLVAEKSARQGLAYAVPQLPYERAISPIAKTSWAYAENIRKYNYDPVQAKRLFNDSPLASISGELKLMTFPSYLDVAQSIASSWTSLGVPTTVQVVSSVPPDYQILLSAQDIPPDPDQYPFWHSTQTQTNITGYVNVKIDKLLEDGRQELNPENRIKIYADFQRRLVEDLPAAFLYYPYSYTITRK
jgi:peptide/nickel transport system substrate-binding protein